MAAAGDDLKTQITHIAHEDSDTTIRLYEINKIVGAFSGLTPAPELVQRDLSASDETPSVDEVSMETRKILVPASILSPSTSSTVTEARDLTCRFPRARRKRAEPYVSIQSFRNRNQRNENEDSPRRSSSRHICSSGQRRQQSSPMLRGSTSPV